MSGISTDITKKQSWKSYTQKFGTAIVSIVGVLGFLVSLYTTEWRDKVPEVSFRFNSSRPLVNIDRRSASDIQLLYQGSEVRNPWLVSVTVEITGKLPLERADIRNPLTLSFQNAKFLRGVLTSRNPADVRTSILSQERSIVFDFDLLNPGDLLNFDLLFDEKPEFDDPSMRIRGASRIITVNLNSATGENLTENRLRLITWPTLPSLLQILVLSVCSLIAASIAIVCLVLLFVDTEKNNKIAAMKNEVNSLNAKAEEFSRLKSFSDLNPKMLPQLLFDEKARVFLAYGKAQPHLSWVSNPSLAYDAMRSVPPDVLRNYNTSLKDASDHVLMQIGSQLDAQLQEFLKNTVPIPVTLPHNFSPTLRLIKDGEEPILRELEGAVRTSIQSYLSQRSIPPTNKAQFFGQCVGAILVSLIFSLLPGMIYIRAWLNYLQN